jgi:hypothetical protein
MIRSKKYTQAAKGQQCKVNIAGVCNYCEDTVVFAHFPDGNRGMAIKADDINGGDACSDCHDCIDGRRFNRDYIDNRDFYLRRAQTRTIIDRIERGILCLK